MKKNIFFALMCAILLMCPVAYAEDIEVHDPIVLPISYEDIAGDAYWPSFRDLHWSMDKEVVILIEQSRGVELTALRDDEYLSVYTSEGVEVLGHTADLRYFFTDETGLYRTQASIALSDDEDANAKTINDLMQILTDKYGAPESDKWQDGAWTWPGASESSMLAIWGHGGIGERHTAGDKYLIGQVGLEARENSDGTRTISIIMLGQMKRTPSRIGN